jgi:hypothetical protein
MAFERQHDAVGIAGSDIEASSRFRCRRLLGVAVGLADCEADAALVAQQLLWAFGCSALIVVVDGSESGLSGGGSSDPGRGVWE